MFLDDFDIIVHKIVTVVQEALYTFFCKIYYEKIIFILKILNREKDQISVGARDFGLLLPRFHSF